MIGSETIRPAATAPELSWVARSEADLRHAFRRADGAAGIRSLCGAVRWTAAMGSHGRAACPDCAAILRQVLAGRVTI